MIVCLLWFAIAPPTVRSVDAEGEPLPPGAVMRLGSVRWMAEATPGRGVSAVFTPDGREVLYWGGEGRVQCRSVATGRSRALPELGNVLELAFRPDGKQLTVLWWLPNPERPRDWIPRFSVAVYEWPSWRVVLERPVTPRHPSERVVLSTDGQFLLRSFPEEKRKDSYVWPLAGEAVRDEKQHWDRDRQVGEELWGFLGANSSFLIRTKMSMDVHDTATGQKRFSVSLPLAHGEAVAEQILIGKDQLFVHSDSSLYHICTTKRTLVRTVRLFSKGSLSLSPDRKVLFSCFDGLVQRLEVATLKLLKPFSFRGSSELCLLAASPDGKHVLLRDADRLHLLDVPTERSIHSRTGHESRVSAMAFSADDQQIATGEEGGQVHLWDRQTGRLLAQWKHPQSVRSLAFDRHGRFLAVGGSSRDQWAILAVRDLERGRTVFSSEAHLDEITSLAFLPDGNRFVSAGGDARLRWWKIGTEKRLAQVRHLDDPALLAVEGDRVLAGDRFGGVAWYRPDGSRQTILEAEGKETDFRRFRVVGDRLLVERASQLQWHDVRTGTALPPPRRPQTVRPVHRSLHDVLPDETQVIYRQHDRELEFWLYEPLTGCDMCRLPNPINRQRWVASSDGRWLLVNESWTAVIYDLWSLRAGALLASWLDDPETHRLLMAGHPTRVAAVRSKLLQAAQTDHSARRLVDQLGEEEFDRRERAERGLREASGLAAPALMAALERNTDLEVRTRCKRLLEAIPPAERARWSDRERLRAMLRGLRHERFPGGEALWEEIGRSFPDSLLRELVRSEKEKKR